MTYVDVSAEKMARLQAGEVPIYEPGLDEVIARNQIYNVAVGGRADLNQLFTAINQSLANNDVNYANAALYCELRAGDVRHYQADVGKAER